MAKRAEKIAVTIRYQLAMETRIRCLDLWQRRLSGYQDRYHIKLGSVYSSKLVDIILSVNGMAKYDERNETILRLDVRLKITELQQIPFEMKEPRSVQRGLIWQI